MTALNSLLDGRGCLELWRSAESEQSVREAVDHQIRKLIDENHLDDFHIHQYRLGPRFVDSVRHWGFHNRHDWARLLIESCARLILGIPKQLCEPFRTDARPTARQVSRASDGAVGWRTHLTKHHEGFRLMFWKSPDGSIEFANIGDKDELVIL